jgi:hypothetical protein
MTRLVIRHGLSEANNRNNVGTLAFASREAPLMEQGVEQAKHLRQYLFDSRGITTSDTRVATSTLERTQQTAREAGFTEIATYKALDEVEHGLELTELRAMLGRKELPDAALKAAELILGNPPTEGVWVSHGLVIAGLCQVIGANEDMRFIPRFCEIREIPI